LSKQIIVVENLGDWKFSAPGCPVVHVDDYLTGKEFFRQRNTQVINLCRDYRYLSIGYYCSLLAEARRHRPLPSVKTMLNISSKAMYSLNVNNLDASLQKSFKNSNHGDSGEFRMEIFFGQCEYPALAGVARQLFETFQAPLLRVTFRLNHSWRISSIKPIPLKGLGRKLRPRFEEALGLYLQRRWRRRKMPKPSRYDIAILHDPGDPLPPSDGKALKRFIRAGRALGIDVELITQKDYARLAEYDALFIRDTTRINHYTYRFAIKAESENMVVIDDPQSILRCTNKVYLAELLRANRIAAPKTVIVGKGDVDAAEEAIGYPMVLKVPDGSFSQGIFKAENREELDVRSAQLFASSELILAQEFLYTEFDWRIGILNRRPLYASQYFMSKAHWQIVHYDDKGGFKEGSFKTMPVEQAPAAVVATAVRAANLIGDGLYGVDLKQAASGDVYVIEVNDNPSIDAGIEDAVIKDELYRSIMEEFVRRLERRHD
jgi:glutathione synthase/RimK-type ligase-like ATP-grasp enzyme